jgi:hypothetical protein
VNKGVKHPRDDVETLTARVDFNGPNLGRKRMGRELFTRAPHMQIVNYRSGQFPQSGLSLAEMVQVAFSEHATT